MWTLLREVSLRHLRHSPVRSALVVFGIALGVSMLSAVLATNGSLLAAFEDMVDRVAGKADLTVAGGSMGIPDSLTGQIAEIEGVEHAAAMLEVVSRTSDPGTGALLVLGVDFLGDTFFLPFAQPGEHQVVDDPLAFVNDPTAVLVSSRLASARGLRVGSALTLLTPEGEKTFYVRGLLEDEEGPASSFGGQIVVMFIDAAQVSFARGTLVDRIDIALADKGSIDAVERRIQELVQGKAQVERPKGRTQRLVASLWVFQNGLNVGGMVALWVGMFLIYNAVAVSVAQRRREVGILRALGVTKGGATRLFCLEALFMAAVGAAIGLLFGQALARVALANVESTINQFVMPIHPPAPTITLEIALVAVASGLLTTLLAAYFPARKSARVDPAEALRATRATAMVARLPDAKLAVLGVVVAALACVPAFIGGEANGYVASTILLSGLTLLVPLSVRLIRRALLPAAERSLGVPARIALDNVERSLGRSAVTVIALMLAVSTSVTIAAYAGSFERSILNWADEAFAADALITAGSPLLDRQHVAFAPSMLSKLDGAPGLASTNPVRIVHLDVLGKHVELAAMNTEAYFREAQRRGRHRTVLAGPARIAPRALVDAPRVLISENLARTRNVEVGDRVQIMTPSGERSLEVYAVVIDYSSDQGWMLLDQRYYREYFNDGQADSIELFFTPGSDHEAVVRELRSRLGATSNLFVTLHDGLREQLRQVSQNVFALARAPELITLLVAIMGVIGTMLAAVIDRIREIGMLRAIGATRRQVVNCLVIEAGFLGLSAALCGVAAGVPQGYIFVKVVGVATSGWNLPYHFPVDSALRVALVIVFVAALAGLVPGIRAARLAVRDALSYE
jgi:putative ABC transport system permease protein